MTITSIDFETANYSHMSICAAGIAVFEDGELTESPYWLVRPPKGHGWFRDDFIECHGLTHVDVREAPEFSTIAPEFLPRLTRADIVIAHNAQFDIGHLSDTLAHFGVAKPQFDYTCTLTLSRRVWPELPSHGLKALTTHKRLTPGLARRMANLVIHTRSWRRPVSSWAVTPSGTAT